MTKATSIATSASPTAAIPAIPGVPRASLAARSRRANSSTLRKRSAGVGLSAAARVRSIARGSVGRITRSGRYSPASFLAMTACGVFPA